jgi:TetR/AcrR family transcriptional regulator
MTERTEATKGRIIDAAIQAFARDGFEGASTRQIAALAGENQGLITYHFGNKETLWKESVDVLLGGFRDAFLARAEMLSDADPRSRLRLLIYFFVRYSAEHPDQMRLMVQEGKAESARTEWLVEHHLRPLYVLFGSLVCEAQEAGVLPDAPVVHLFYTLIGATSLIFAHAPECRALMGSDPTEEPMVEAHAETICRLILRDP